MKTTLTDPRTGRARGTAPVSREPEVAGAVSAARAALPGWSALTPRERAERLGRLAASVEAHAAEYSACERAGTGKPESALSRSSCRRRSGSAGPPSARRPPRGSPRGVRRRCRRWRGR
ncbi:aldehyde dehydrogenase family protein [Streptomyces sp. NPDC002690]